MLGNFTYSRPQKTMNSYADKLDLGGRPQDEWKQNIVLVLPSAQSEKHQFFLIFKGEGDDHDSQK